MQRLLAFIEHNIHIMLFVILQVVCGFLIFRLNPYQKATLTNSVASVTASSSQLAANVSGYIGLKEENLALQNKIAEQFRNESVSSLYYLADTFTVRDTSRQPLFDIVPAQVVYNTSNKAKNIFIINKGSDQGIKRNMGVISSQGIAGKVIATDNDYSTVMSLLNTDFNLIPNINDVEYYLPIDWENKEPNLLSLKRINKLEMITEGDVVKTGTSTVLFPRGITIGTIDKVHSKTTSQYCNLDIVTATDFRKLRYVYVIINNDQEDIEQLIQNAE
jgi:rod shape-determining protein MreC